MSLDVRAGETVGLVGESGSGKSTLGRAALGLAPVTGGTITLDGEDIAHATRARRRELAVDLQVIFQDPYSSLSPSLTVGDTLAEPLRARGVGSKEAARRVRDLLDLVHLPADAAHRLPREFSGGQRQRVAIARAIALEPRLIVCDEPVSALDLTTQARILELLLEVQVRTGVAYLFVSHDLNVVRVLCHRVAVMRGRRDRRMGRRRHRHLEPEPPLHAAPSARLARGRTRPSRPSDGRRCNPPPRSRRCAHPNLKESA